MAGYCMTPRRRYPLGMLKRKTHTPIAKQAIWCVVTKLHLIFLLHCVVVGFLPDCRSIQSRARVSVDIRRTHSGSLKGTSRYALRMQTRGNASTLEQLALHSE
jgi:hypothetical protein